ncbi:MAG: alpha/beta hydrolase [Jatrophihabitantaceae bacterium]
MSDPKLIVADATDAVHGVALVLHGGRSKSRMPVRAAQPAVLRMRPFVSALRAHSRNGLVVAQLRYRVRGWNGAERSPVPDTRWALDRLAQRYPGVPIALVGHSMGGRAAMYAADHDAVRSVVGLAPWIEPGDPVRPLAGRRVLIMHGDADRMTDPRASASFARSAEAVAEAVTYVGVGGERHAMLRRASLWHRLSTAFVAATVLGRGAEGSVGTEIANILGKALAGEAVVVV